MTARPPGGRMRGWWDRIAGAARNRVRVVPLRAGGVRGLESRVIKLWLPPRFQPGDPAPLLVMLDGQTAPQWRLADALREVARAGGPAPVVAAVPASGARLDEYGTAGERDFAGRGARAKLFQDFVVHEVVPAARERAGLPADPATTGIFGASMGGLSAFDTAWRQSETFGIVGAFSGSFWWRADDSSPSARQASRIMHRCVREAPRVPRLRCWFQAGTQDERADRDGNGVIDAIQDTRELMGELARRGFREGRDMVYREVSGGEHNERTWAGVLPEFLRWAAGEKAEGLKG